jgi:phosphatidylinositol glycan class B
MMRLFFLLVCLAAWFTAGYFHPDEHFQILEFANWKMGGTPTEVLPWEFGAQMRPGLQPALAVVFITVFKWMGCTDPFIWAFLLRLCTGCLTWWVIYRAGQLFLLDSERPFFYTLVALLWFMPMLSVRFSSEQTAALALMAALFQLHWFQKTNSLSALFWTGAWLGISFDLRFQMAFAGIGVLAWLLFSEKTPWKSLGMVVLGGLCAVGLGVVVDRWFYGSWVLTPWNYFFSNVVEDKASNFGVSPFWWYLPEFLYKTVPPMSLLLLALAWKKARKTPGSVFVWLIVPFLIGHSMVAHKELRFLFPMLLPFLLLATQGYTLVANQWVQQRWWNPVWRTSLVLNVALLAYTTFLPLQPASGLLRFLWQHPPKGQVLALREHPYGWVGVDVWFYRPAQSNIQLVPDTTALQQLIKPGDWVIASSRKELPASQPYQRIYSVLPDWIMALNVNNWQERTRIDQVFELQQEAQ